jgi:hypothetical protein
MWGNGEIGGCGLD